MKKSGANILIAKFENHKVPQFIEKKGKEWVLFGEKNDYPDYLITLFNRSADHNAIVTGKASYIAGKGFKTEEENVKAWLKKAKVDTELLTKLALDLEVFNGFCFQVIWNNAGSGFEIHYIDFSRIRSNEDGTKYFYSEKWLDRKPKPDDLVNMLPFDLNKKSGKQLFYYKFHRPGMSGNSNVYPLPDYVGAVTDIETDIEVSNFHFNNIKNGFWGGMLLDFANGIPTEEEQKKIAKQITEKHTGTDHAGRFVLNFTNGKDRGVTISSLTPPDLDKQFEQLAKRVQQKIFTGHKITSPMLFGIKTEGQLGGRNEILEAWEHFFKTYVSQRQEILINVFDELSGLSLEIEQIEPVGKELEISENNVITNLTRQEIRDYIKGYYGLELQEEIEANTLPSAQFKRDHKKVIEIFSKYGQPAENFHVIKSKRVMFSSDKDCLESELELYQHNFAPALAGSLNPIDKAVLDLIKKDPRISAANIAKAIRRKVSEVVASIGRLTDGDLIEIREIEENDVPVIEKKVTDSGSDIPTEKSIDIFVMYEYDVAPGLGAKVIPTTRDFCRDLINMNKMFSRKDIESISQELGYSVWQMRGGFYHNPKTGTTTPYCRHVWNQRIVKKKR